MNDPITIIAICITLYSTVSWICGAVEHRYSMKAYEQYCYMYKPKPGMDAADFLKWLDEEKKNGKSRTETSEQGKES